MRKNTLTKFKNKISRKPLSQFQPNLAQFQFQFNFKASMGEEDSNLFK